MDMSSGTYTHFSGTERSALAFKGPQGPSICAFSSAMLGLFCDNPGLDKLFRAITAQTCSMSYCEMELCVASKNIIDSFLPSSVLVHIWKEYPPHLNDSTNARADSGRFPLPCK